jgi:hypothetical protein
VKKLALGVVCLICAGIGLAAFMHPGLVQRLWPATSGPIPEPAKRAASPAACSAALVVIEDAWRRRSAGGSVVADESRQFVDDHGRPTEPSARYGYVLQNAEWKGEKPSDAVLSTPTHNGFTLADCPSVQTFIHEHALVYRRSATYSDRLVALDVPNVSPDGKEAITTELDHYMAGHVYLRRDGASWRIAGRAVIAMF